MYIHYQIFHGWSWFSTDVIDSPHFHIDWHIAKGEPK